MGIDNDGRLPHAMDVTVTNPLRRYLLAVTDYVGAVAGIQLKTTESLSQISCKQLRGALGCREAQGWQAYWDNQARAATEVVGRMTEHTCELGAANQKLLETACEAADETAQHARCAATVSTDPVEPATNRR